MASSKVMPTTSTSNQDLPRQSTLCSSLSSLLADFQNQSSQFSSSPSSQPMNMDDLLKNIYTPPPPNPATIAPADVPQAPPFPSDVVVSKSVEDVWKEIVAGAAADRKPEPGGIEGMTLEDFLTKAGAVREEDVRGVGLPLAAGVVPYGVDTAIVTTTAGNNTINTNGPAPPVHMYGNGMVVAEVGRGRGKRRAVEEPSVDRATQQKQRRMIKNRESAARSRERKQAYTVELESLVTQLEEEKARLLKEEAEKNKQRLKQLMENLIPVVEKRRPPRVLRRVNSVQW